jgi:hypothetical protein
MRVSRGGTGVLVRDPGRISTPVSEASWATWDGPGARHRVPRRERSSYRPDGLPNFCQICATNRGKPGQTPTKLSRG